MSDDQFDNLFDDETEQEPKNNGPKQLREAFDRQKQENEKLRQELADVKKTQKESSLKQFIESKGLPEKALKLIGDQDPEEWFKEFGDVFAAKQEEPNSEDDDVSTDPTGESSLSQEQQEQLKAVNSLQPGAPKPGSLEEQNTKLDGAQSLEEVYKTLAEQGRLAPGGSMI